MKNTTENRRVRYAQFGVPAAVVGALAGTLTAAPAMAENAPLTRESGTSPARVTPQTAPPSAYTVRPGDTVFGISERFGLRTSDVLEWNALTWRSVIQPGHVLTLSGAGAGAGTGTAAVSAANSAPAPSAATHVVVAGDTLFSIAQQYGTTTAALFAANGLDATAVIFPGQLIALSAATPDATPTSAPAATAGAGATHTVVAGDTLFGIARQHGTTTAALFTANGLEASSIIYPGQVLSLATAPAPAPASAAVSEAPAAQQFADLNAPQAENAAMIIRIGRELGVSDRGIAIALSTSMVESWLRNLDWGDRDSLGLFQQRPSMGWGTAEQIRDRDRSIRVFYGGPQDPNGQTTRGLLDIPAWEQMSFTDAAQAVQISAYPERYGTWEAAAYRWIELYG